jgi:putative FmdB family regulatory protein
MKAEEPLQAADGRVRRGLLDSISKARYLLRPERVVEDNRVPLYEYQCTKCGHQFEMIQKFSDSPKTKCPKCGGRLEKLVSAPAIQFKGSGWYVTDYGKGSGGSAGKKPESKKTKDESGSSTTESKPGAGEKKDGGSKK